MKKNLFLVVFFLVGAGALLSASDLEVGASIGANFWSDTVGVGVSPEVRWLFGGADQQLVFGAGAIIRYNFVGKDGYAQNEVNVLALGSVDYLIIPKLSARAQVGIGGGWLGANGGGGASVGAFSLLPAIGIQYDLDILTLHLLVGTGLTVVPDALKNTPCLDFGATYRFKNILQNKGTSHE